MRGMNHLQNFAGFTCDYTKPDLITLHLLALMIAFSGMLLIDYFQIRKIKAKGPRVAGYVLNAFIAFFTGHLIYQVFVKGDFLGCGISPLPGL